uniref:Transposase n=1 Tax=Globodera rostochiensis TaxID=31243 RepID=A0A914H0K0_GLORO
MEEFWVLILLSFFATNSLDKAESVQLEELEELPLQTFDELFVDEWWDKDEAAEDLKTPPTNFGQNVHHQIDRQNTQLGQIEPNSTDPNPPLTESDHSGQIKPNSIDQLEQIESNSTDENPPLTESVHSDNAKNDEEITSNENIAEDERKLEKFDQMKAELMRAGTKNSYTNQINEIVAKELGLSFKTIYAWKREFGQTKPKHKHSHSEQKELMKRYYQIKDQNPKIRDEDIAKTLKIGGTTLFRWKKQLRQHLDQNSVDGHI